MFQVSMAHPGRRQPQVVPGCASRSPYSTPGSGRAAGETQHSSAAAAVDAQTQSAAARLDMPETVPSAPESSVVTDTREEVVSSAEGGTNGVMHASEVAQAAVQAAAHEAHARVPQPEVPPVLAPTPSLGITSARGSSTLTSKDRTNSHPGANKVLSRGRSTQ
jgi:hypothetical protein